MSDVYGVIDHFYEVIPGRWLLIGWSSLAVIKDVVFETAEQQSGSISICPVRLPRLDVAAAFNDERFNQAGFVAFVAGDGCAAVQSVVLGAQSLACRPLPLPPECSTWPSRLQDLLNVLHVQTLPPADLHLLLRSGLLDLVVDGANHWNSQRPWKDCRFEHRQLGCRHGQREMTLVLMATTPNHQLLLAQLERLCWDPWCISGRVHVVLICDQGAAPDRLSEALQSMLVLEQMSLDLILPVDQLGLFDCVNLGVHLAQTDAVIVDPSCLILQLSAVMQGLRGPALLEPKRLLMPSLDDGFEHLCPPMWFCRDCFFDVGALPHLGMGEMFVMQQLCRSFDLGDDHGVRHVDDLPFNALRTMSQAESVPVQSSSLQPWQDVVSSLLAVS